MGVMSEGGKIIPVFDRSVKVDGTREYSDMQEVFGGIIKAWDLPTLDTLPEESGELYRAVGDAMRLIKNAVAAPFEERDEHGKIVECCVSSGRALWKADDRCLEMLYEDGAGATDDEGAVFDSADVWALHRFMADGLRNHRCPVIRFTVCTDEFVARMHRYDEAGLFDGAFIWERTMTDQERDVEMGYVEVTVVTKAMFEAHHDFVERG